MQDQSKGTGLGKFRTSIRLVWPIIALLASYLALAISGSVSAENQPLWASATIVALLVSCFVFLVWSVVSIFRLLGMVRRHIGIYTKSEKRGAETQRMFTEGWARGTSLLAFMASAGHPRTYSTWDVVLHQDELLYIDTQLHYSRYFGTDASYLHTSTVAVGRASFVIGSAIGNAVGNARARNAAIAAAQPMWREPQYTRTLVTSQRILCRTVNGWLSFYWGGVTACHADPAAWTVAFEFNDSESLKLHGPDAPSLCVLAIAAIYGHGSLTGHPALDVLR